MMSCRLALNSQSFHFYLLRCYKNPVLRAATLRELNENCGRLRLGPYKDRARAIIQDDDANQTSSRVFGHLAVFTVGMLSKKCTPITKLDRDVADIRCACAVRDLGNGGCAAATSAIAVAVPGTRPERPALTPAATRACRSLLTTGIRSQLCRRIEPSSSCDYDYATLETAKTPWYSPVYFLVEGYPVNGMVHP
ncbi:unnamed protein product [Arctia plantaginis]|uniref:Uncharacterized protein n=1 Tax=Arctia plantaginis TaxID=874455 RepID=A0A8S0ZTL0_ARCPL|nr:unnamed protein product [Arctia plantaginis]